MGKDERTMELFARREPSGKGQLSLSGTMDFIVETYGVFIAKSLHVSEYPELPEDEFVKAVAPAVAGLLEESIVEIIKTIDGGLGR